MGFASQTDKNRFQLKPFQLKVSVSLQKKKKSTTALSFCKKGKHQISRVLSISANKLTVLSGKLKAFYCDSISVHVHYSFVCDTK